MPSTLFLPISTFAVLNHTPKYFQIATPLQFDLNYISVHAADPSISTTQTM